MFQSASSDSLWRLGRGGKKEGGWLGDGGGRCSALAAGRVAAAVRSSPGAAGGGRPQPQPARACKAAGGAHSGPSSRPCGRRLRRSWRRSQRPASEGGEPGNVQQGWACRACQLAWQPAVRAPRGSAVERQPAPAPPGAALMGSGPPNSRRAAAAAPAPAASAAAVAASRTAAQQHGSTSSSSSQSSGQPTPSSASTASSSPTNLMDEPSGTSRPSVRMCTLRGAGGGDGQVNKWARRGGGS